MKKYIVMSLIAISALISISFDDVFAEDRYGDGTTFKKLVPSFDDSKTLGEKIPTKSSGFIFKICKNSPWSTFGWEDATYATWDQQKLKQHVVSKCVEAEKNFSLWPTGKLYLLIIAPSYNTDKFKVDTLGGPGNPISCSSRDAGRVETISDSESGFMTEIGHDTGVFGGSISLGGPYYKRILGESNAYQYGGTNNGDPYSRYGSIKTCGLKASSSGAFTVTWEYAEDQKISKSVQYSYREADIQFGKDIYFPGDKAKIIVYDRDVLRWSWDNKYTPIHVWSDTDKAGVTVGVTYDRQFWIPVAADGRNSGYVELSLTEESRDSSSGKSAILKVSPGDNIYMEYKDYTMPPPFSQDGCKVPTTYEFVFGKGLIVTEFPDIALSECKHKRIVNAAKVSEKSPDSSLILTTTDEKDLPNILYAQQTDSIKIPDNALVKYSPSGKYLVKTWWEHDRQFLLNTENKVNVVFYDGLTEKQMENIRYHFTYVEDGKIMVEDKLFSVDGHQIHKISPSKYGVSEFKINHINGDESEEIKFKVTATDEIFEISPVVFDEKALEEASIDDIVEYLEQKEVVPRWIEFSVNHWVSEEISDQDFVQQIRYLIKNNIL
ncbi:MAG: hypothetical protein ACE5DT_06375 [Nitrosopumilus sp.]